MATKPGRVQPPVGIQVTLEVEAQPPPFHPHLLGRHPLISRHLALHRPQNHLTRLTTLATQTKTALGPTHPLPPIAQISIPPPRLYSCQ